jgi:hypothetical protein
MPCAWTGVQRDAPLGGAWPPPRVSAGRVHGRGEVPARYSMRRGAAGGQRAALVCRSKQSDPLCHHGGWSSHSQPELREKSGVPDQAAGQGLRTSSRRALPLEARGMQRGALPSRRRVPGLPSRHILRGSRGPRRRGMPGVCEGRILVRSCPDQLSGVWTRHLPRHACLHRVQRLSGGHVSGPVRGQRLPPVHTRALLGHRWDDRLRRVHGGHCAGNARRDSLHSLQPRRGVQQPGRRAVPAVWKGASGPDWVWQYPAEVWRRGGLGVRAG